MRLNRLLVPTKSAFSAQFSTAAAGVRIPTFSTFRFVDTASVNHSLSRESHGVNGIVASILSSRFYLTACRSLFSLVDNALWFSSTLKKRRSKMNKHKLRKRKKLMRKNTKQSRN